MIKKVTKKLYQQELEDFKKLNPLSIVADHALGCFFKKNMYCFDVYDGIIIISANLPYAHKVLTLYHEIRHYQCHKIRCECVKNGVNNGCNHELYEQHAYTCMLEKCLEKGILPSLKFGIDNIEDKSHNKNTTEHERNAAQQVLKTKLYKDCVKFIKDNS